MKAPGLKRMRHVRYDSDSAWRWAGCYAVLGYTNIRMSQGSAGSISTLIVDDEQLAREELSFLVKDFAEIDVLAMAANGLEAVNLIEKLEPDLVFLDVQMP